MSRFLSPAKICLILLIDVYHDREVQPSDTIHILSYISRHILKRNEASKRPDDDKELTTSPSLASYQALLAPLKSNFPGRSLYDVFLKRLWRLASFDELDGVFQKSRGLDADTANKCLPISPSSPIGQYLRRCHLEFIRLQFSDAQLLWEDLLIFRGPSWNTWASRNPEEAASRDSGGISIDEHVSPILLDRQQKRMIDGHDALPSQDLLDKTVQFQLEQIQGTGCRLSSDMQEQLAGMIKHSKSTPADTYFISFFNSWRSGAYNDAIDNLHRYFDYAMEGYGSHQAVKTYHQYALLHLAVLHADFGSYEEAIATMDECIATARENQDSRCLNFGLSWLVHLRKAHPEYVKLERIVQSTAFAGSDSDILFFLQQKALENKDWTQLSGTLLSQAEMVLQTSVSKALDYSYQSHHLNAKYALHSLQPTQIRLHASLFGQIGLHSLAQLQNETFTTVFERKATRPEALSLNCVQAYRMAIQGEYERAMGKLRETNPASHRTLRMHNLHLGFANMVSLKKALHRKEMIVVERLMRKIKPLRSMAEPDIAFETHILELEYLQRADRSSEALEKIDQMFEELKVTTATTFIHRIRLLITKANLWAHAGKPSKAFSIALRAANAGYTRSLVPLMCQGVTALATILIAQEEHEATQQILDSIIPRALELGDPFLSARLYSLLTDSLVGQAMAPNQSSKETDALLNSAQVYLERAKEGFAQVEDLDGTLECLQKKIILFRYRGEEALAEEMEGMYAAELEESRRREREVTGE
ncbi:Anaphase-promoting complex subunit 5-like protein [Elsinoe fawcettii]|nr:Anaphase-promoting complex subunit 5-like protein [Elsinoe fawcettii]